MHLPICRLPHQNVTHTRTQIHSKRFSIFSWKTKISISSLALISLSKQSIIPHWFNDTTAHPIEINILYVCTKQWENGQLYFFSPSSASNLLHIQLDCNKLFDSKRRERRKTKSIYWDVYTFGKHRLIHYYFFLFLTFHCCYRELLHS